MDDGGGGEPRTREDSLPAPLRRPLPAGLGLPRAQGAPAAFLWEGDVRVLAEQFLLLGIAAPGITARPGGPLEVLVFPVGQFVAMKCGPVPVAEPPPQDAGESREEAPEGGKGPDGPQGAEAATDYEKEDCGEECQAKSREDEEPRGAGWIVLRHGSRLRVSG